MLGIAAVVLAYRIVVHHRLVRRRAPAREGLGRITVPLRRRADLLPILNR